LTRKQDDPMNVTRRSFLSRSAKFSGGIAAGCLLGELASARLAAAAAPANLSGVKALVFDTFGTVVDWRGTIIREGEAWGNARGLHVDWARFADRWHGGNPELEARIRSGAAPWMKSDPEHRLVLDQLLKEFNITGLTEDEKDHWNRVYHRMTAWPDSVEGLTLLKKKYIISAFSNGDVTSLVDMAKFDRLPWDMIISAEMFHHNKPDKEMYLRGADLLGCKPNELMLVAAHPPDLRAAQSNGLHTALVLRPLENGPGSPPYPTAGDKFDLTATSLIDLAHKLA
jgi:2-haloacid dehalogenase